MGRNRAVAATWPGNVLYHKVLEQYVDRYIKAQDMGARQINKTLISLEILHVLQKDFKTRFLSRVKTCWMVIDDIEAQTKIGQATHPVCSAKLSMFGLG